MEENKEKLTLALEDYLMMIENHFPLENARFIVMRDYELGLEEQKLLESQMLRVLEDKVRCLS